VAFRRYLLQEAFDEPPGLVSGAAASTRKWPVF